MSAMPPSSSVTPGVAGMTPEQIKELAEAYIDLLKLMVESLEECETGWGFFSWSGQGFDITGHPPADLISHIQRRTR